MRLKCVCAVALVTLLGACGLEDAPETDTIQSELKTWAKKPVDTRTEEEARKIQETRRARRPIAPMSQMQGPPPGHRKLDPSRDQEKLDLLKQIMTDQSTDSFPAKKMPIGQN